MPEDFDDERDDFDDDDNYPPPGFPAVPDGWPRNGRSAARRGALVAATALVAAGAAFGIVDVAIHDVSGSPAATATPTAGGSGGVPSSGPGNGAQLSPQGGGAWQAPSGAMVLLEIGGPVSAVSATSITIGRGDRMVTATVTSATKITGKVTSIGGIKVGDLVSASLSGPAGKLVAASIQDPASLPSGPGQ